MKLSNTQIDLIQHLQGTWNLKEAEFGYILVHAVAGYTQKVRNKTVTKLIELGILEYRNPDDKDDPYLKLTGTGYTIEVPEQEEIGRKLGQPIS